jgi:medium-chain acyl-[acyl-carrier-protein] hydrolase
MAGVLHTGRTVASSHVASRKTKKGPELSMQDEKRSIRTWRLASGRLSVLELSAGNVPTQTTKTICGFPYAGGSPLVFRCFAHLLPSDWTFLSFDLPGHVRTRGTPHASIEDIVDDYLDHLQPRVFHRRFLLGHSMGGCIALALASRLERLGIAPAGVIVSATVPPAHRPQGLSELDDRQLISWMKSIGQDVDEPSLFELFKTALRADLTAFERWTPSRIASPLLVLAAVDDPLCAPEHFREWLDYSDLSELAFTAGGHFFIERDPARAARAVAGFVARWSRPAPRRDDYVHDSPGAGTR